MNRPKQYVKEIPGYFYSEEDDYLGEGKFGKVYRCTHKETGNIFAAKKIERRLIRGSNESNAFQEEKEILNNIDHPNIIKAHDYQYTKNSHYLIIDYCNGGTLRDKMEKKNIQGRITPIPIPEGTAIPYLMQILNGIYYLHVKKGIMHRDIKPENILLHQGNIVITDLGSAKRYEGYSETYVGTEIYQAPELLELNFGDGRNANYDYRVDLWSIGVVYYEMLYARLPFIANTNIELRKMINSKCGKNLVMNPNIKISDESQDLLRGLLSLVKERFEWKDIFQHKLFKNFKAGSLKRSMPKGT